MNKKKLLIALGLVGLVFSIAIFQTTQGTVNAKEARIVSIFGGDTYSLKSIRLEPQYLTISKDTVVIWNNWARAHEVKVIFEEGKKCQDVTDAPTGFKLDFKSCYVTSWIPLGGTSSLRFTEKGVYKYVVETSGSVKGRGEIRVN
jgi:hypothetical protein